MRTNNFIGTIFGEKSQLTVVGWDGNSICPHHGKKYDISCSICEKDEELFPEPIFKCTIVAARRGVQPCGCSKKYIYSNIQKSILLKRACDNTDTEFEGVVGKFESSLAKTVVKLRCKIHGNTWETKADAVLKGKVKCKLCFYDSVAARSSLPEEVIIDRLTNSGNFIQGTKFIRISNDNNSCWNVICPVCSTDMYALAGIGATVFKSTLSNLTAGYRPCRCGNSNLTSEQKIYGVEQKCKELQYDIVSITDSSQYGIGLLLKLKCKDHGVFSTTYKSFIRGSKCRACSLYGFDPQKQSVLYVLKIVGRNDEFTGFGISGNWERRKKQHVKNLSDLKYDIAETTLFEMNGENALKLEKLLIKSFKAHTIKVAGFKKESSSVNNYNLILEFCKDYLDNL